MGRWTDVDGAGQLQLASRKAESGLASVCGEKFVKVVTASQGGAGWAWVAPLLATATYCRRADDAIGTEIDAWLDRQMDGWMDDHFHHGHGELINQLFTEFPSAHYIRIYLRVATANEATNVAWNCIMTQHPWQARDCVALLSISVSASADVTQRCSYKILCNVLQIIINLKLESIHDEALQQPYRV